jgi:hypothetical protein
MLLLLLVLFSVLCLVAIIAWRYRSSLQQTPGRRTRLAVESGPPAVKQMYVPQREHLVTGEQRVFLTNKGLRTFYVNGSLPVIPVSTQDVVYDQV